MFTRGEVAAHNTATDLWVVIKGGVYELSEYVDEHPGGVEAITKHAGGDATKAGRGALSTDRLGTSKVLRLSSQWGCYRLSTSKMVS